MENLIAVICIVKKMESDFLHWISLIILLTQSDYLTNEEIAFYDCYPQVFSAQSWKAIVWRTLETNPAASVTFTWSLSLASMFRTTFRRPF